MHGETVN